MAHAGCLSATAPITPTAPGMAATTPYVLHSAFHILMPTRLNARDMTGR